ncbi:MAG: hypothetical protein WBZ40_14095 [Acidimicrobiia bacterium]
MAEESERHFFRGLFKFLLFAGLVAGVGAAVKAKKAEYMGLTESEARAKFEPKLASRIGPEKAAEIADQVIPKLKESGFLKADDPVEQAMHDAKHAATDAADRIEDAASKSADKIGEAASDAVEKIEEVAEKSD